MEEELKERSLIDTISFKNNSDREKIMKEIECIRRTTTYQHDYCDEKCKK